MSENLKETLGKILSYLLIFFGLYQIIISSVFILFTLPNFLKSSRFISHRLQEGLIEKAIILYLTTVIDGFYGVSLLVKPSEEIEIAHLLIGLIILIFSKRIFQRIFFS